LLYVKYNEKALKTLLKIKKIKDELIFSGLGKSINFALLLPRW